MTVKTNHQSAVRLHLTNVAGAGATQLLQSLLPALEQRLHSMLTEIYLPDRGELAHYRPSNTSIHVSRYERWLPNAISRLLECTLLGSRFDGEDALFVLGDLPLRCNAFQTVFVQTSHLLRPAQSRWSIASIKFAIARMIFRLNMRYAIAFIVQTTLMKDALIATYPAIRGKVHVIAQPVPSWLLETKLARTQREVSPGEGLSLIYPAASYPHKNHKLLSGIATANADAWPVQRLVLTVSKALNPAPSVLWVDCVGFLSVHQMIQAYRHVDALLFLSRDESYGFPLVEAMFVGLPIISPDLPYARILCGEQAIYFIPDDLVSLKCAVCELHRRLANGWWPDWSPQLASIPTNWDAVAQKMIDVVFAKSIG